jgi:hypothetical protein
MTNLPDSVSSASTVLGSLSEPAIQAYFETLNAGNFQATANLFAAEGQLLPPFESPIVGRDAILAYLETEARGVTAMPQAEIKKDQAPASDQISIAVVGKVQTALFIVNVEWLFLLNSQAEILSVKIKLLASLQDLLNLKR